MTMEFEKFTLKRVLFSFLLFASIILIFIDDKLLAVSGLLIGTLLGSFKLLLMGAMFNNILGNSPDKFLLTLVYSLALVLIYGLILTSFILGLKFFIFFFIGVLLINFVVFADGIIELLGISKKNFD